MTKRSPASVNTTPAYVHHCTITHLHTCKCNYKLNIITAPYHTRESLQKQHLSASIRLSSNSHKNVFIINLHRKRVPCL